MSDSRRRITPNFKALDIGGSETRGNKANRDWWEKNPMTYDWKNQFEPSDLPLSYFSSIDNIFGQGHSLINNPRWPNGFILERFIPYKEFAGKEVLEIGCGAGLVASHIAKNHARLTAIDLTQRGIDITNRRFQLMGLSGTMLRMDAEKMEFRDQSFDFVVSWGVIHHSGNMQAILNEIHRVLRPGGKAYLMIYNRHSLRYQIYCRFWLGIICARLISSSISEINGSITDGYIARHLVPAEVRSMASRFHDIEFSYSDEKLTILKYLFGVGLPFKYISRLTHPFEQWLAQRWGWYLQIVLTK